MNAYQLPYLSLFRGCIILRCVCFFLIFSLNYQQGVTQYCICIDKWEEITKLCLQTNQKQTYRHIWIWQKFTIWKGWIIFWLSPKLWSWHELCLPCFLPARSTRIHASLRNQNKCKSSIRILKWLSFHKRRKSSLGEIWESCIV